MKLIEVIKVRCKVIYPVRLVSSPFLRLVLSNIQGIGQSCDQLYCHITEQLRYNSKKIEP